MKERITHFLVNLLAKWPWKYTILLTFITLFILICSMPFAFANIVAHIVALVIIITMLPLIMIWGLLFLLNFNEIDW